MKKKRNIIKKLYYIVFLINIVLISGCEQPFFPWNAGPSWSSGGEINQSIDAVGFVNQAEIENFCNDNMETIESYRIFLRSPEPWHSVPRINERRRRMTTRLIEQFDRECNQ